MKKENQKQTRKLSGFYIALCCCVLMIGIAGYFTEKHTEDSKTVSKTEITEISDGDVFSDSVTSGTETAVATLAPVIEVTEAPEASEAEETAAGEIPEAAEIADYAVDNPDVLDNAITVSSEQPAFILPVSGEVVQPFTDVLSYNSAMNDWRTHGGIDIAADKGCSVQSVAQGEVERVYDNAMGACVEISHAGGFVTRYMGLENVENLSEGKEVQSGEVIGTVGDCKGENVTQPHLHFEMEKNGVEVNPSDFLPH